MGLQSGRTDIVFGQTDGEGIVFEGTVGIKTGKDGLPDFTGPLVHGKPGQRFVYLSWGVMRDGVHDMFRRLKLYVSPVSRASWEQPGLSWDDLASGSVEVEVEGCGADGTPACGTAKSLWRPIVLA